MKSKFAIAAVFLVLLSLTHTAFSAPIQGEMVVGGSDYDMSEDCGGPGWNWDADTATLTVTGSPGAVLFTNTSSDTVNVNYTDGAVIGYLGTAGENLVVNGPGNTGTGLTTDDISSGGALTLNNAKVTVTPGNGVQATNDLNINNSDLNSPMRVYSEQNVNINGNSHVTVPSIEAYNNFNVNLSPGGIVTANNPSGIPITANVGNTGGVLSLGANNEVTTPVGGKVGTSGTWQIIVNPDGSVTQQAVIQNRANYVSFDTNGGSGVPAQEVPYQGNAAPPAPPTKAGSSFAGWYQDAALTIPFDFSTPITGATVLYAKWTADPPVIPTAPGIPRTGDAGGLPAALFGLLLSFFLFLPFLTLCRRKLIIRRSENR